MRAVEAALALAVVLVAMAPVDHPARRMAVVVAEGPTRVPEELVRARVHAPQGARRLLALRLDQLSSILVREAIRLTS